MHWSACAYAHADKCIYFKQVQMLTHAAYHFSSSMQRVMVSRALCNFGRKKTWCQWWHKVHMNQLKNCQVRYRSNTWVGQTRSDGPDEFESSKFDCIIISLIQHFEADFLNILNSGIILKTFTHMDDRKMSQHVKDIKHKHKQTV